MTTPLLSICIPTYNRCDVLEQVLLQYVANPEFDEEVELIISDNASDDRTKEIGKMFAAEHKNIRYYRNDTNIFDSNFAKVLDYGNGEYLKLSNDWVFFTEESLKFIKEKVREYGNSKEPIFFTNDYLYTKKKSPIIQCANLDEYVQAVSTFVTCNSIFGVWRNHWSLIEDKLKYTNLKLNQVDWTYQIVEGRGCTIFDKEVLKAAPNMFERARGGYNWFKIHMDNYYLIMDPYIRKGKISKHTFEQDKIYLLWHFVPQFKAAFIKPGINDMYDYDGTASLIRKHYCDTVKLILNALAVIFYVYASAIKRFVIHLFRPVFSC